MAYIPEDQINRLKDSIDIVELISQYVELKPSGQSLKGLCPFHNEKTPSFMVNRNRNTFHCFGCHEGGDGISFIMKIENLDYIGAVKFIAEKQGVILDEKESNSFRKDTRDKFYKINALVAKFYFRNMLIEKKPQQYIKSRGLDINMVNRFFLGYAKNGNELFNFLIENKVQVEDMIKLGLVAKDKNTDNYYDKFRDRLIFPIINNKRKVIGFGGRTMNDSKIKYLNSPESEVFIKGDNLYGIDVVSRKYNRPRIILVEGYMDVIGLNNQGIDYAIASLGTALTENQARLVKRYGEEIYIAYDSDTAGIKATNRAIEIFEKVDVEPKIVEFPQGMDPDEFILKYGKDKFEKSLKDAKKSLDYKLDLIVKNSSDKYDLTNKVIEFLASIQGNVVRELYAQKAAKMLNISYESLMSDVVEHQSKNKSQKNKVDNNIKKTNKVGYNNNYKEDNSIGKDQYRVKLEKEIVVRSLLNKDYFDILKDTAKSFIKLDYLSLLYSEIEAEYANTNESHLSKVFESETFKRSNLQQPYKQLEINQSDGDEKIVSDELLERVNKFLLDQRLEEIYEILNSGDEIKQEEKVALINELVKTQKKLTQ